MDTDIGGMLSGVLDFIISFGSDFFAFIVIAALVAAFAFYFGRDRLVPLIAGAYAALILYTAFPFSYLGTDPYLHTTLYLLLTAVAMVAFSGLAGFMASGGVGLVKVGGLSLITAGLLMAIAINALPVKEVYAFSPPTLALFSGAQPYFWWLLAPIVGVFLLGK